jgi:hypothetical protein
MNFLPRLLLVLLVALAMAAGFANAADLPTFRLIIKAGRFQPETVEVPANTKFRLLIKNEGPGPEEFESTELIKEKVLAEGVESFLIFQPLKPGSYAFFGEFHPDTAKGRIVAK